MKRTLLFVVTLFFSLSLIAQDQLTNANFENWTPYDELEYPDGWVSFDACATIGDESNCVISVTKDDDAQSGTYSARLATVADAAGEPAPGMLFTMDEDGFGQPFTGKPIALVGYHKFHQENSDQAGIQVMLFPEGSFDENSDEDAEPVGYGELYFSESVDTWTRFVLPITYYSEENSDRVVVSVTSGDSEEGTVTVGTYLMIDNLSFAYTEEEMEEEGEDDGESPTSVLAAIEASTKVYPIPAESTITIECSADIRSTRILNMHGEVVQNTFRPGKQVNVGALTEGVYIIEVDTPDGLIRKRFVKR